MNKNIVVCGASRGIGLAIVRTLCTNKNLHVYALSRNLEPLQREFKGLENLTLIPFDLEESISSQLEKLLAVPELHGLINNAGILEKGAFSELPLEAFNRCLRVNFTGPVELIQTLLPQLIRGKAHIVNISSMGAYQGSVKFSGLTAYASSKAAITNFTEVFAEEYKDSGMQMNCLCLGSVNTEMLQAAFPGYEACTSAEEMGKFITDFTLNSGTVFNGKILPVSSSTP